MTIPPLVTEDCRPADAEHLVQRLKQLDFRLVTHERRPSFGDVLIELTSDEMTVRVGCDRGTWFVDVRGLSGDSYDIALWRNFLERSEPTDEPITFAEQSRQLLTAIDQIRAVASSPDFPPAEEGLRRLGLRRARIMFPGADISMDE